MGQMTKEEIEAAMDQITNCVATVRLPRLTMEEIEELTRPKKRRAKKRYSTLDFSDDRLYFQKTCTEEIYYPKSKRSYNYSRKRKKNEKEKLSKKEVPSYLSPSDMDVKPWKKFDPFLNEMGMFGIKEETDPSSSTFLSRVKTEPREDPPKNAVVWRIRIKSAYELGSNISFVDVSNGSATASKLGTYQPVLSDLITSEAEPKLSERTNLATKFDIHTISNLYKEFFTNENRIIIKKVAEVLLSLTESIKKKNDKLTEINCSRSTDAEKLMLRHQAHNEFNRIRDANQSILKKQFEAIGHSLRQENFEILFQLFFLGIMKTLIVSVSNKKGTLFKKIVSLLSQSLSSCDYQNERILNLLRSKDFRADCTTLVHFLEKCSETKSFDMLFISEADKTKLLSEKSWGDRVDMSESSNRPSLLSVNAKIPSIVKYSVAMKILPVGSNLLLQSVNSSSIIQPKVNHLADINGKKTKIISALLNSMKPVKLTLANQTAPNINAKKAFPQPNFNAVASLPYSAPSHSVSRTTSATTSSTGPPPYSIGSSSSTISYSAVNALPNSTLSSTRVQPMSHLANSNSSAQPGGGFTNFSSSLQPMCSYPVQSSNIQTSCTFTNCNSLGPSGSVYMNSNVQPVSTRTNSCSSTNTIFSNCNQPVPQLTLPPSSTTVPTSSYPFVMHTSQPPVVPTYTPNVVLNSLLTSGRPHSVIVTSSNLAVNMNCSRGPPPSYSVTNIGGTTRGILQPSPPMPQLLPPVVPPLQPQPDAVSARGMMQSSSPMPQLSLPARSDLHSQSGEDIGRGIMQPSSPLAQLHPPAVPNMFQSSAEPAATAVRRVMQLSPPLPQLLPPAVPNLHAQSASHTFMNTTASDTSVQNFNERSLPVTSADNRSEFAVRTYSSAKEVNKRGQVPSIFDQNDMVSEFHQSRHSDNPVLGSPVVSARSPHHFIVPESFGSGMMSATVTTSQANGPYSSYRTISPAGNCENIQPHSPHSLLHQNTAESGSRLLKDSNYTMCPTTNSSDALTLRTLLMDNGRAPLVNQNGPVEAPFQYSEKVNFSLDLPPVLSPEAAANDTLATSHLPMVNYRGDPFSC